MNDMLWNMGNQKVTTFVAIHLLIAFDTVVHDILLSVLEMEFDLSNDILRWFDSCRVNVGDHFSSVRPLDFSVPQGFCIGPVLYSVYISKLKYNIPDNI